MVSGDLCAPSVEQYYVYGELNHIATRAADSPVLTSI